MKRVYFIKPIGMDGPVKIGSSYLPVKRLEGLSVWSPFPLEIIAEIDGDSSLERRFHAKFLNSFRSYEWFDITPEMQATVDAINSGFFDVETLPPDQGEIRYLAKRKDVFEAIDWEYTDLFGRVSARWSGLRWREHSYPVVPCLFQKYKPAKKQEALRGIKALLATAPRQAA